MPVLAYFFTVSSLFYLFVYLFRRIGIRVYVRDTDEISSWEMEKGGLKREKKEFMNLIFLLGESKDFPLLDF